MPAPRWNPGRHRRGTIVTSSETGESLWPSGACPLPRDSDGRQVTLAHGEGGRETRRLIENCIWRLLPRTRYSGQGGDAARLPRPDGALAFTTDSYVVTPLFFPGGDIGELAVYGTVNDLAVMGAVPLWLSLAFIVEEGFPMSDLEAILQSIAAAATRTEVEIVTGDTKVVPRGAADGIYLNTSGVGVFVEPIPPGPDQIQPGDMLVVSGPIGRHGLAILAARENLGFEPAPLSDCAPVTDLFRAVRSAGVQYRAARDATRGGWRRSARNGRGRHGPRSACGSQRCHCRTRSAGRASCWAWIPCFWRMKGTSLGRFPPSTSRSCCGFCTEQISADRPRS